MSRRIVAVLAFSVACGGGDEPSIAGTLPTDSIASQWASVGDWQNSSANARNTGYVPVTLDPAKFRVLWTSTGNVRSATRGSVFTYKSAATAASGSPEVSALDAATGIARWTHAAAKGEDLTGIMPIGGKAYFVVWGPAGSEFWGLDAATGSGGPKSQFSAMTSSWTSLVPAGGRLISTTLAGGGGIFAFDTTIGSGQFIASIRNGQSLWAPAYANGIVSTFGAAAGAGYSRIDLSTATTILSLADSRLLPAVNTRLSDNGTVLGQQSGHVVAVDAQTGALRWDRPAPNGLYAVANGVVYVTSPAIPGTLSALSESTGGLLWQWQTPSGAEPSGIVVTKNLLFAQGSDTTYAIDLATHQAVWKYPVGGASVVSPDGILLINGNSALHPQSLVAISLR